MGGGLSLVPPECVPSAGRELSVGEGRAGGADGRRRWGERARERVNKCGAQRARTCNGRGLRVVAGATVPQCPSGSGAGIQCFRCLVCVWGVLDPGRSTQAHWWAFRSGNPKARGAF